MYGPDVERVLDLLNQLKDETAIQIENLARVADYRMETIDHTHTAHIISNTGSPEGVKDGGHDAGEPHTHANDMLITGRSDPPATDYRKPDEGHTGPDHFDQMTDQLTYPVTESRGYLKDLHNDHQHIEPSIVYEKEHPEPASQFISPILSIRDTLQEDVSKWEHIESEMYVDKSTFHNQYGSPWKELYMFMEKIEKCEEYANQYPELQWRGEKHSLMSLMHTMMTFNVDAKWALLVYHDWIQRAYDHLYNGNSPSITWDDFVDGAKYGGVTQSFSENVNLSAPSNDPF